MSDHIEQLKALEKKKDFFVGIDSDGCAFDSMEIKHKECFIPNIINSWECGFAFCPRGCGVREPLQRVAWYQPLPGADNGV